MQKRRAPSTGASQQGHTWWRAVTNQRLGDPYTHRQPASQAASQQQGRTWWRAVTKASVLLLYRRFCHPSHIAHAATAVSRKAAGGREQASAGGRRQRRRGQQGAAVRGGRPASGSAGGGRGQLGCQCRLGPRRPGGRTLAEHPWQARLPACSSGAGALLLPPAAPTKPPPGGAWRPRGSTGGQSS